MEASAFGLRPVPCRVVSGFRLILTIRTLKFTLIYSEPTLDMKHLKRTRVPQAIAGVMLLLAFNPDNPYGYYVLLRWVICGIFAFLALQAFEKGNKEWVWILGITAGVYNPFIPLHLGREIWALANLATIGVAITSIFKLNGKG